MGEKRYYSVPASTYVTTYVPIVIDMDDIEDDMDDMDIQEIAREIAWDIAEFPVELYTADNRFIDVDMWEVTDGDIDEITASEAERMSGGNL